MTHLSFGLVVHVGEAKRFFVDQLLEGLLGQIVELHGDAEWFFGDGLRKEKREKKPLKAPETPLECFRTHLIGGVVVLLQVGVRQSLLDRYPLVGIEREHFAEQVKRLLIGLREELVPWDFRLERQRLQVTSRLLVHYAIQVLL